MCRDPRPSARRPTRRACQVFASSIRLASLPFRRNPPRSRRARARTAPTRADGRRRDAVCDSFPRGPPHEPELHCKDRRSQRVSERPRGLTLRAADRRLRRPPRNGTLASCDWRAMSRPSSVLLFACIALGASAAEAQTKLLRYPDIHGDRVAFCYAGDIWTAPASGGTATRITAHPGLEVFPKFSPDGEWIAFTGEYDGDEQVYVIPSAGGVPKQLTFYPARGPLAPRWGYDNQVYGWSHDGKFVQGRSMYDKWGRSETRQYLVPVAGGLPKPLAMPVSGAADFSPDETKVVYNPTARDFRTWKRYQGGWQQDLYIYDLASGKAEKIAESPRTERDPMWIGDKIYFNSDRDGHLNLYVWDTTTHQTTQITKETTYDVRWPSDDEAGRIVFELNGELRILDVKTGKVTPISILVPNDGVAMRPNHLAVDHWIEDFGLSPKGERAVMVARGDVFTLPIEKGPTRNL